MNMLGPSFIAAAGRSKYALTASAFVLVYFLCALFFKKERTAVKLGAYVAAVAFFVFVASRLFPKQTAVPADVFPKVKVSGNGNGTAVGNGNCVDVTSPTVNSYPGTPKS